MITRLSLWITFLLSARLAFADPSEPPALRGVVFIRPFAFETAVAFRSPSRTQAAKRGYLLAIEVDETPFVAQSGPMRSIFIDQTAAVWIAGPLGSSAHPYVLVLVPEVDLSSARLWLGSRALVQEQSAASMDSQPVAASSHGSAIRIDGQPRGTVLHSLAEATALVFER